MAVVFPRENNALWPLPSDYPTLTATGKKKARLNACRITGRPDLDTAAWAFFRDHYLIPQGPMWYKTGFTASPDAHYQWVYDWNRYDLLIHAAPRGTSKTTINLEDILRKVVCLPYWECALFLSTQKFASDRLGRLMDQVEHNNLIIDDFGKLKGRVWNRGSSMELNNGSSVRAMPMKGASLGTRPSGLICLDDVEKSDDQVITPSDLRDNTREFFFNALHPMAQSPGRQIPMRIIGTLYNRRMFIYWLYTTDDSRIKKFWKRTLLNIEDLGWDAMGPEWQEKMKLMVGPTAWAAQYMNDPGTASTRMLSIHPELCTYWLENEDGAATTEPFASSANIVTHQLKAWHKDDEKSEPLPVPKKLVRKWSDVVANMRRFITVDWASTTGPDSDYSVIHVMGFENAEEHRDTLYSLDIWWGRARTDQLIRIIYQMALRWGASLIGVEAYPVKSEFYERVRDDLPSMYGGTGVPPRILPLKFPPHVDKPAKIMGLEWRFNQFRIKLPMDRHTRNKGYERLFWEVENSTEDLALLDHDDCVDSLALHAAIGKPHQAVAADMPIETDPIKLIRQGTLTHDTTGLPVTSGMNASEIPPDLLHQLLMSRYDALDDEYGEGWEGDGSMEMHYGWMGLPASFYQ